MSDERAKVVIIGAGFGGIEAATSSFGSGLSGFAP